MTDVPSEYTEPLTESVDGVSECASVRTSDGVELSTDVYLPGRGGRGGWPTVLVRTPYDKRARAGYKPHIARYLADHGYAVVLQDVRGRGRSTGIGHPFLHEAMDGNDTLEWISRQSWSTGRVAMVGGSYCALTQWAAAMGHPALVAIVPDGIALSCDYPIRHQGVPWLTAYRWFVDTWTSSTLVRGGLWEWTARPLIDSIPSWAGVGRSVLESWIGYPHDRSYQLGRIFPRGEPTRTISVPALHIAGWWDIFCRSALNDWHTAATRAPAHDHQFLVVRAADHHYSYVPDGGRPPDHWSGDDDALARVLPDELRPAMGFLDRYLKGNDAGAPMPRVSYATANASVRTASFWPPPGIKRRTWFLAAGARALASADGGSLSALPDRAAREVAWPHDPDTPVPSLAESDWDPLFSADDEAVNHGRPDVATFTAPAVDAPLDLCGPVAASLVIDASARATHLIAVLTDVAPGGRAQLIAYGASHVSLDVAAARIEVDLGTTAYRVRTGHRLRLAISSSLFPRYALSPGTGEDPLYADGHRSWINRLRVGGPWSSSLRVTVRARS